MAEESDPSKTVVNFHILPKMVVPNLISHHDNNND